MNAEPYAKVQFSWVFLALFSLSSCSEIENEKASAFPSALAQLCDKAYRARLHNDYVGAEKSYRSALSELAELKDRTGTAVVSRDIAELCLAKGNLKGAAQFYEDSADAYKALLSENPDNGGIAVCAIESLRGLAAVCIKERDFSQAKLALNQSLELAQQHGLTDLHSVLESESSLLADLEASKTQILAEKKLFNSAFSKQEIPIFKLMRNAWLDRKEGNLPSAIAELRNAERLCNANALEFSSTSQDRLFSQINELHRATCQFELGLLYRQFANNSAAIKELEQAYLSRRSILWNEHPEALAALEPLLLSLCAEKNWDRASELLLLEKSLPEPNQTWQGIRETLCGNERIIAERESAAKDFNSARKHAQLALSLGQLSPVDKRQLLLAWENSGTVSFRAGVTLNDALVERAQRNIGVSSEDKKKRDNLFSEAETCYTKANSYLPALSNASERESRHALLLLEMASTMLGKNKIATAKAQFDEAAALYKTSGQESAAQFCRERAAYAASILARTKNAGRGANEP